MQNLSKQQSGHNKTQPAAKTSSVSNDAPLPGLKQPSPVTPQVKDRGITIPTFLQKNKK